MRKILISFNILFYIIGYSVSAANFSFAYDSSKIKLLFKLPFNNKALINENDDINDLTLLGNNLLILIDNRIFVYNLLTNQFGVEQKLNYFISENLNNDKVNSILALNNKLYIGSNKAFSCIDTSANIIYTIHNYRFESYLVDSLGSLWLFQLDTNYQTPLALHYDETGKFLNKSILETSIETYSVRNARGLFAEISYLSLDFFSVRDLRDIKAQRVMFTSLKQTEKTKDLHLACASPGFLVWVPIQDIIRNTIVFTHNNNNMLYKEIQIPDDILSVTKKEAAEAEGIPNYQIVAKNDNEYYIVVMKSDGIYIYYLKI